MTPELIQYCRNQFPALQRTIAGQPAVFLDGPAGTQVPQGVIDAIGKYLTECNANCGGCFATSQESDALLHAAHQATADFVGTDDPDTVAFDANMTSITFAVSRALAKTWSTGDEIVVTRTEHDANFTPWVLAARDAGATVRYADVCDDTTLDIDDLRSKINERTKLVAVGCASNATGTINPVREVCDAARAVGALSYVDAVHYAPHTLIDVSELGCDLLACSAYKFFGPHVGILWGRRELLESTPAYKVRPASDSLPGKWMTGTQNHEGIAGVLAAIEYLADLGRHATGNSRLSRRDALESAFGRIHAHEQQLAKQLLAGLAEMPEYRVWGISDQACLDQRMPTVSITHGRVLPRDLARQLGARGIFVWHGNYYALPLTTALGVEPDGMVRLGIVHYNTANEIDRLLRALSEINAGCTTRKLV